ncbi:Bax inhibitor 1 [Diplonema papillatum]|nr:Bax inhibitor 1 [Diplonema papillatum]KAJ9461269.1 Bax inhibitor 1 [Diplonema papillatum]|eukprot:gene10125-15563_t
METYNFDPELGERVEPKGLVSGVQAEVDKHISDVYKHLLALFSMATMGFLFQQRIGAMNILLPFVLTLACLVTVFVATTPGIRLAAFFSFGFLDGWMLGPLVTILNITAPLMFTAIMITTGIFLSFTLSARYAKRGAYLYLGGILGSCILGLLACSILFIFFPIKLLYVIQLYGGLVVFSLYVAYDTQVMVERAHNGIRDPLTDSISLFIDFMGVLRRVLIILAETNRD